LFLKIYFCEIIFLLPENLMFQTELRPFFYLKKQFLSKRPSLIPRNIFFVLLSPIKRKNLISTSFRTKKRKRKQNEKKKQSTNLRFKKNFRLDTTKPA